MILVDIYIPSLDDTFDFRVDETAKIINVIQEISEMMCKKYKTVLNARPEEFYLCSAAKGDVFPLQSTLAENEIINGSKLILV